MRSRTSTLVAAVLGATLVGAGGGAALYGALSTPTKTIVRQVTVSGAQPAVAKNSLTVGEIYRRAYEGVVEVTVSTSSDQFGFGGSQTQQAQGSGWVYDTNGDIITNQHVVDGASSIKVKFWNGASYSAHVVGTDASTDVAVIKVDAPSSVLHPLSVGDSSKVAVGDPVVAIGSPFGLSETVTSGIVSALHRQMTSPNNFTIDDSIQTDAAINHGNSGGPLLNAQGRASDGRRRADRACPLQELAARDAPLAHLFFGDPQPVRLTVLLGHPAQGAHERRARHGSKHRSRAVRDQVTRDEFRASRARCGSCHSARTSA